MRVFVFFCCVTAFGFNSKDVFSQDVNITIIADTVLTVDEVFDLIKDQTDFKFIYQEGIFDSLPKVHLKKGVIKTNVILERSLSRGGFNVRVADNNAIVIEPNYRTQQTRTITGTVTDDTGMPIPNVNVFVTSSSLVHIKTGVKTDFEGKYTIEVQVGETLTFSHISFETQTVVVVNQDIIDIVMEEREDILGTVVLTGYQKIEGEDMAGATAKANMEIVQNRSTSMNILDRIDGLMPGVVINHSPTNEEGVDNSILIRGLSTINANRQPLFVVDGVPASSISSINPRDIADITVLKDASASAIYGSRAANGVLVITTKKGRVNSKIKFNYNTFLSLQGKPDLDYIPTLNSRQFIELARNIFDPNLNPYGQVSNSVGLNNPGVPPHEQILYDLDNGLIDQATADARLDALASFNNTEQIRNLWYRNAMLNNHTISATGGSDKYTFYSSMAYTGKQNSTPGDTDDTYKIHINQDFRFSSKLKVGLIVDLTQRITSGKRPITIDNRTLPYLRFQDEQGNSLSMPYMQNFSRDELPVFESLSGIDLDYNPLEEFDRGYDKGKDFRSRITANINWELLDGLELQGLYGYVRGSGKLVEYDEQNSFDVRLENATVTQAAASPGGTPVHHIPLDGGHYYEENSLERNWVVRNQLNFNREFNDRHHLNILVGQEFQEQFFSATSSYTRAFDDRNLTFSTLDLKTLSNIGIQNPVVPISPFGRSTINISGKRAPLRILEDKYRFTSYYSSLHYTYQHKYVINGSARIDHSNLFGKDKAAQNKPVWSAGVKWLLGNEDFLDNSAWLNELALRITYGITGNAPTPGTAASFDILSPASSSLFDKGFEITTPGNPGLTWESTKTFNMGIDFGLYKQRLRGSIDYYSKRTDNLIGFVPTNSLTGYTSIIGNFGSIENNGLELVLRSLNVSSSNFSWQTQFILAYNKNKIIQLNQESAVINGRELINKRYLEGYSAFSLFAYDFVGLDEMGDPQIRLADGTITKEPFVARAEDMKYTGTYQPKWSGGLTNTISFKNFSLNANIVYNLGHVMRLDSPNPFIAFSGGRLISNSSGNFTSGNLHPDILLRWRQPGDEDITNVPSYVPERAVSESRRNIDYYTYGDINVASASYIKLRDISLIYNFPDHFINKLNFSGIALRLQLNNIMLWKKNDEGIDPEFHNLQTGHRSLRFNQGSVTIGLHVSI